MNKFHNYRFNELLDQSKISLNLELIRKEIRRSASFQPTKIPFEHDIQAEKQNQRLAPRIRQSTSTSKNLTPKIRSEDGGQDHDKVSNSSQSRLLQINLAQYPS
jgi:hypothetical protein